jgi:hypothetical protein
MPCQKWFRLCLSHFIYTVRPCLCHACSVRAVPRPCPSESDFSRPRHSAAWEWRGMCELAWAVQRRHAGVLHGRSASSGYHAEFYEGCYQQHTTPLNCRTSSSGISGYHADFHQRHGTLGEWQGRDMACMN